jgi:site-specific recombinase XerD
MTDLIVVPQPNQWQRLKALVLDSVSSPITKRVCNLGLDEFFEWFGREQRPGFTKATVSAWRVALEARGLGSVSINVRITAVRKLAAEAADNGLLAPELAAGIARVKSAKSMGVRTGNWLSLKQAQALLNAPDITTTKGLRDPRHHRRTPRLRPAQVRSGGTDVYTRPAARWPVVHREPPG